MTTQPILCSYHIHLGSATDTIIRRCFDHLGVEKHLQDAYLDVAFDTFEETFERSNNLYTIDYNNIEHIFYITKIGAADE